MGSFYVGQMKLLSLVKSQLAVYAAINAVAAGATFLMVPLLVRLLGLDGFGFWTLLEPVVFFGAALAFVGAEHGVIKQIAYDGHDLQGALGELLFTGSLGLMFTGAFTYVVAVAVAGVSDAGLVALLAMTEGMLLLIMAAARASRALMPFALAQIGRSLMLYLALVFVIYLSGPERWDVSQFLALRLGVVFVIIALVLFVIVPRPRLRFDRLLDAIRYGLPILVMGLLLMIMENADRYFLGWHYGTETVGSYVVHVKLASVVSQGIIMPFSLWFAGERLRHMNEPDGGSAFFDRTAVILVGTCCTVAGGTFIGGSLLIDLLAPDAEFEPLVLGALLLATVAMGMTCAVNIGLLKPGATHLNLYPVAAGLLTVLVASFFLTPYFGPAGSAIARLIGTIIFLLSIAIVSQNVHKVIFSYGLMFFVVFSTSILASACSLLSHSKGAGDIFITITFYFVSVTTILFIVLHLRRI